MSAADLIAVLGDAHLRYDVSRPDRAENDRLIFSKGHASPLLYAWLKAAGAISDEELLSFRRHGSLLEGHPSPRLPWVDVATGSLGQGLPIAVGLGLCGKRLDRLGYRVWCLCGDGEMAEGSMWEAIEHAGFSGLDNLTLIVDVNRLGQSGGNPLRLGHRGLHGPPRRLRVGHPGHRRGRVRDHAGLRRGLRHPARLRLRPRPGGDRRHVESRIGHPLLAARAGGARAFEREGNDLESIQVWVADWGEGRWTIAEAIDHDVPAR